MELIMKDMENPVDYKGMFQVLITWWTIVLPFSLQYQVNIFHIYNLCFILPFGIESWWWWCIIIIIMEPEKKENREKKRYLMGESMGGAVALMIHRKQPDFWDGAILVAPMCKVTFPLSFSFFIQSFIHLTKFQLRLYKQKTNSNLASLKKIQNSNSLLLCNNPFLLRLRSNQIKFKKCDYWLNKTSDNEANSKGKYNNNNTYMWCDALCTQRHVDHIKAFWY